MEEMTKNVRRGAPWKLLFADNLAEFATDKGKLELDNSWENGEKHWKSRYKYECRKNQANEIQQRRRRSTLKLEGFHEEYVERELGSTQSCVQNATNGCMTSVAV